MQHNNRRPFDRWTAVHFATGIGTGVLNVPPVAATAGAVGYEVLEQVLEDSPQGQRFFATSGPESPMNVVVDLAVFALGYAIGNHWR